MTDRYQPSRVQSRVRCVHLMQAFATRPRETPRQPGMPRSQQNQKGQAPGLASVEIAERQQVERSDQQIGRCKRDPQIDGTTRETPKSELRAQAHHEKQRSLREHAAPSHDRALPRSNPVNGLDLPSETMHHDMKHRQAVAQKQKRVPQLMNQHDDDEPKPSPRTKRELTHQREPERQRHVRVNGNAPE